jgi:hypothetical protein
MATKNAHWQAAFRRRMREAGLKAVTVWLPKEGAVRLARYPERERGEVVTRALVLLESQGELTGESRGEDEAIEEDKLNILVQKACAQVVTELSTRLERVEATLSAITSNSAGETTIPTGYFTRELADNEPPGPPATPTGESTRELTGEAANEPVTPTGQFTDKSRGEEVVALSETPPPPVPEPPVGLPLKRIPALIRQAKKLHTQGVSFRNIAHRFNAEGVPTRSGTGQWHGSTIRDMVEKLGTSRALGSPRDKQGRE